MLIERGIVPENLPPAEDVKKVERRLKSDEKKALKGEKKSKDDAIWFNQDKIQIIIEGNRENAEQGEDVNCWIFSSEFFFTKGVIYSIFL